MNRPLCAVLLLLAAAGCSSFDPLDYVSPYIGSAGHGHVFVGASAPNGAIQAGPQNIFKGWDWCSGYHYSDSVIIGFSHTHLSGTGCKDLGDILIMPFCGEVRTGRGEQEDITGSCSSYYRHENESVSPYLYTLLMDNGIYAKITSSPRVAFHEYSFPEGEEANILINLYEGNGFNSREASVRKEDDFTVTGHRTVDGWAPEPRTVYFAMKTDCPVVRMPVFNDDVPAGLDSLLSEKTKAVLTFAEGTRKVKVKVSVSFVSTENALENIEAEVPHWNFRKTMCSTRDAWHKELEKVRISTDDAAVMRKFYTAMYHTLIAPVLYCDVNGEYMGLDGKVHCSKSNYSIFSCWDTYRAFHPWMSIIQRDKAGDMVSSMLSVCDQQGKLPIWTLYDGETNTMPGYGSVAIVSDALLKDLPGIDRRHAYECLLKTACNRDQDGIDHVLDRKFIPADMEVKATSMALEYAVSDWGIAAVAERCGDEETAGIFKERAGYWRCYFDTLSRFVRPRMSDGSWASPYDPAESIHGRKGWFTEGTGWQYTFLVPQDPYGLIDAMGGDEAFCGKLDSLFTAPFEMGEEASMDITGLIGQYAHGNEPSHHVAYLYAYAGQQWKTAELVRHILDTFYLDEPDGIAGNEDCGQMSAWYILSALGFYQVNPCCGEYSFGSPAVDKAVLNLPGGKRFIIEAENNSPENRYIQSVSLDGRPYSRSYVTYGDIMDGGTLTFEMGPSPARDFGADPEDRPQNRM